MTLLEALSAQITQSSRARGEHYFRTGAVRSLVSEHGVIHASVRGSTSYDVWIETHGAAIMATCTCPYFEDRLDICKHIWAVVLAAIEQKLPLVPPDTKPEHVSLSPAPYDDEDPDLDPDFELDFTPPPPPRRTGSKAPPAWLQLLDTIDARREAPPLGRSFESGQILYVVDAPASLQSNALVLELMTRDRKQNGEWGKPRAAHISPLDVEGHRDPAERAVIERLIGARPHYQAGYGVDISHLQLRGAPVADVMPQLCALGTCILRTEVDRELQTESGRPEVRSEVRLPSTALRPGKPDTTYRRWETRRKPEIVYHPIAWDDGPAWLFRMAIEQEGQHADGTAAYRIDGWLERGSERMPLDEPLLLVADGIVFTQTHAARFDAGSAFTWLVALQRTGALAIPAEGRERLLDSLAASLPIDRLPDDLRIEVVDVTPRPRLRLHPVPHRSDRLRAEVTFDYAGTAVPAGLKTTVLREPGSTRAMRRDIDAETRAVASLHQHGCRPEWEYGAGGQTTQLAVSQMPRVVRALLNDGWHVEARGQMFRRPGTATMSVTSGIDWFELHGQVEYGEATAPLPALLEALANGTGYVLLSDGSTGLLPEDWLRRYAPLARLGTTSGNHVRFKPTQAMLLDALIAELPEVSCDEAFARVRSRLPAFSGITPVDPPAAFTGTLRNYQREGLGWLQFLQQFGLGGCLADDMGLGKTVMVLALLAARREAVKTSERRPSLVVAPRSVVFNWQQEAERFTPDLRVLQYVGGGRSSMRETLADYDLVLTTYGTLRRDAQALASVPFDYVVLDEAQAIKNASSVSAKATRVLDARHRLALSGTPIENHLGELWSLFEFLNPGLLGGVTMFNRAGAATQLDDEATRMLSKALRPFMLRRTKEQVASDLPAKSEQTLFCELERPQRALYDELLAHYRGKLLNGAADPKAFGRSKLQVLEALLRLRQAACHPGLVDPRRAAEGSAKLEVLLPRIVEAVEEGHKTLVFSQFTSFLSIVRAGLDKAKVPYEYLDGKTRDRQSKVERFQQDPECRLFLISLKAGGLGLNLTAAEYVFLLDPWWNPAVEAQAIDRAHRIGQSRHVFAYRLIVKDTVEERVVELQQRKRKLADAILSADGGLIRDLKREDLELLLS